MTSSLPPREYALPAADLSHDEGDPRWHVAGGKMSVPAYDGEGRVTHYTWTGLSPGHYAEYWRLCVAGPWEEAARAYEASPGDAHSAWTYVDCHPVFWRFDQGRHGRHAGYPANHVSRLTFSGALIRGWPEITPHRVCPETGRHEDDAARNTRTEWWYELGPEKLLPDDNGLFIPWHDYALDGGAGTYEDAVIALARVIHDNYGNDRAIVDSAAWLNGG